MSENPTNRESEPREKSPEQLVREAREEFGRPVPKEYWDEIQYANFCGQEDVDYNRHLYYKEWNKKIGGKIKGKDFIDLACGVQIDPPLKLARIAEARRYIGIDSVQFLYADCYLDLLDEAEKQRKEAVVSYEAKTGESIYTSKDGKILDPQGNRYAMYCKIPYIVVPGPGGEKLDISVTDDMLAGLSKMEADGTKEKPYSGRVFHISGVQPQADETLYFEYLWSEVDRLTKSGDIVMASEGVAGDGMLNLGELEKRGFKLLAKDSHYKVYIKEEK